MIRSENDKKKMQEGLNSMYKWEENFEFIEEQFEQRRYGKMVIPVDDLKSENIQNLIAHTFEIPAEMAQEFPKCKLKAVVLLVWPYNGIRQVYNP